MVDSLGIVPNRRWLRGPMIGLVVAAIFVAHDVAMAGAGPASSAQHPHSGTEDSDRNHDRRERHGVNVGFPSGDSVWGNDGGFRVTHPSRQHGNCGIAPDVLTVVETARRFSPRERCAANELPDTAGSFVMDIRRNGAPSWSPTVRRALLQVYRI